MSRGHSEGDCRAESGRHLPVEFQGFSFPDLPSDSRLRLQSGLPGDFGGELRGEFRVRKQWQSH